MTCQMGDGGVKGKTCETERETDRDTDTETRTKTQGHRHRDKDTWTHGHIDEDTRDQINDGISLNDKTNVLVIHLHNKKTTR